MNLELAKHKVRVPRCQAKCYADSEEVSTLEVWHIWVIAAIVLFIGEIFTPSFFLACLGVGCLASGLISYLGTGLGIQIVAFCLATLGAFWGVRPLFLRHFYSAADETRTNVEALVGRSGLVSERIDPGANEGRVIVGGEDWRAVSTDETAIETGEKITVVKVEGTKLFVQPASTAKGE